MRNNRKKCLVCKEPMARWIFGIPDYESVKEGLENNTILIGDCIISDNDPIWTCLHCCISYRYDGVGYVDKGFIENRAYNSPTYSSDTNEKIEVPPYQLPDKIKTILKDDFLEKPKTFILIRVDIHPVWMTYVTWMGFWYGIITNLRMHVTDTSDRNYQPTFSSYHQRGKRNSTLSLSLPNGSEIT